MSRKRQSYPDITSKDLARLIEIRKKEKNRMRWLKKSLYVLLAASSCAILAAALWLPVLQISGTSMTPTLTEGNIVLSLKQSSYQTGDIVAFSYNNKVLVKRVIAGPGDMVDISISGVVSINGTALDEPYVSDLALGETDLEYPYQVPDGRWFVMGDHRSVSIDSRTKAIGTVAQEQIVGKLIFCLWPLRPLKGG